MSSVPYKNPFLGRRFSWCYGMLSMRFLIHNLFTVCVQYVAVSYCLSARQMATSKQCRVPIKEVQRLDHTTKLEASLPRQLRCHCSLRLR